MTNRELMQQALDALFMFVEYDYQGNPLGGAHFNGHKAIEALRARLAQPDLITPADVKQLARIEKLVEDVDPYTTPPKREWQGLMDEEIDWLWGLAFKAKLNNIPRHFARMVEEKLKEKNHGN